MQKGQKPQSVLRDSYPLETDEVEKQMETNNPFAQNMMSEVGTMPTITLEVNRGSVIAEGSGVSPAKVMPDSIPTPTGDPETNLRTQFIDEKAIQPDDRLR